MIDAMLPSLAALLLLLAAAYALYVDTPVWREEDEDELTEDETTIQ